MSIHGKYMFIGIMILSCGILFGIGSVTAQTYIPTMKGILALTIQPSLDSTGTIKAANITKAELLSTDGSVVKTATITDNVAKFDISTLTAGDYFIRVNDLIDDLVPTRIDDVTGSINQFVGAKLKVSIIGSISDPVYEITTFSKGQGEHPVVRYSDGTNIVPESYAYTILSMKASPQTLEIKVLGTGSELNKYTPGQPRHPDSSTWSNKSIADWLFSKNNHAYSYNGVDNKCNTCHIDMDKKPATISNAKVGNGMCYKCHYGKGGKGLGFIDTIASNITETKSTPTITNIPSPISTPKTPAFEIILAISILILLSLIRRYKN